jgi:Cft2 family RNA processing exonuclease
MIISNLNPGNEIGASAWHVQVNGSSFLLDAGLHPKLEGRASVPMLDRLSGRDLDAVIFSHCHYDHVAGLPLVLREFPRARVIMSELSSHLIERVLHNSANVMKRQREEKGLLDYPLYDNRQIEELSPLFEGFPCRSPLDCSFAMPEEMDGPAPKVTLYDAGHTLGACGTRIQTGAGEIFYTGDCSFQDQILLKGADFDGISPDVLIMETTRGAYDDSKTSVRAREVRRLREAILEVFQRGGSVLIPSFALGRTQEILAMLAVMTREGMIPRQPVHVGGLGKIFTEIYDGLIHKTRRNHTDLVLSRELNLVVQNVDKVRDLRLKTPRIFVVTAGMMNENTAAHELAIRFCSDPRHAIFFVGYADPSTPGGRLRDSVMSHPFHFSDRVPDLVRESEMRWFDITGHANRQELVDWALDVNPSHLVLAHGDPEARAWFSHRFQELKAPFTIHNPDAGEVLEIPDFPVSG